MSLDFFNKYFIRNKRVQTKGFSPLPKRIIRDFNKTRPLNAREFFCNAPFRNMYFSPEGDVFVCCYNQKQNLGNIKEKSIKEIWNSETAENVRNHIKKFDLISGCDECKYALFSGQYESVQITSYDKYPGHFEYPTYMEFQISNVCNLECTMCTGDFSTSIASNREKRNPDESYYDHDFLLQLEPFIPFLKHVMFSGGEPFISAIYFDIWTLIHKNNPSCNIMVQTNGTILNDKVKKVLEGGIFNIGISLDSLNEETYKNIRVNANLNETIKNIMFFKDYCHSNKHTISISICPMQQNWHEIPDIVNFCNINYIGIYFCNVWFPGKNALWVLDSSQIQEIITKLSGEKFKVEKQIQEDNVRVYNNLIKTLNHWYKVAYRWENYQPKEVGSHEIEKNETEIFNKIRHHYDNNNETEKTKNKKANVMIARLKKTFNLIPNNDIKLKGLQMISGFKEDKIIANMFREDDEGLHQLVKNLHRFREL